MAKKPTRTKRAAKKAALEVKPETVLVLRTCRGDLTSYEGFRWTALGLVEAPDWKPIAQCGNGLHGLLWGEGRGDLLSWEPDAKWLVVEVEKAAIIDLGGKVKFPRGVVVFCGDRKDATDFLAARAPVSAKAIVGSTATAGVGGTATAGYRGTATAGVGGTLSLRWWNGRWRIATFYVGEDGIEPNTPYRVDEQGKPVKVEKKAGEEAA